MRQMIMLIIVANITTPTMIPIIRNIFFVLELRRLEKPDVSIDNPLLPTEPTSETTLTA
jgi:hypothetical protein